MKMILFLLMLGTSCCFAQDVSDDVSDISQGGPIYGPCYENGPYYNNGPCYGNEPPCYDNGPCQNTGPCYGTQPPCYDNGPCYNAGPCYGNQPPCYDNGPCYNAGPCYGDQPPCYDNGPYQNTGPCYGNQPPCDDNGPCYNAGPCYDNQPPCYDRGPCHNTGPCCVNEPPCYDNGPCFEDTSCCNPICGIWNFRAEYLAFQPLFTQVYYAQDADPTATFPTGNRITNDFNFKSAYRLYGSYIHCGSEFQFIWTHLPKTSHRDTATGRLFVTSQQAIGGVFTAATSDIDIEYFALDGLMKFFGNQCRYFGYHLKGGVHYANVFFKEELRYTGAVGDASEDIRNRSHMWGIGPEVAFEACYFLNFPRFGFTGFGLIAGVKGSLLASHFESRFRRVSSALTFSPSSREIFWNLVAMWDIRLGLHFNGWQCNWGCIELEIGYEMLSYRDAINKVFFPFTAAPGISSDLYSDASFQGPYVSLEFVF